MNTKLTQLSSTREYLSLEETDRIFIEELNGIWQFSFQENRLLIRIARDLETWREGSLKDLWGSEKPVNPGNRNEKDKRFRQLTRRWEDLKDRPKDYSGFRPERIDRESPGFTALEDGRRILGDCPVASEKTRCCNLKTLDAVINCGYDCTYCSIQSFYHGNRILFHRDLREKLAALREELDPEKTYHIGTGQSSDSLMWGNREGVLEDLMAFAADHPNVVLELKTKSDNITDFLNLPVPHNVLATWSLNTETVIRAEERLTAPLEKRLQAARTVADRGIPVGFHFHPMVWYKGWEEEYTSLINRLMEMFSPEEVVTVSLGTLTFIKPVLKELRQRPIRSKILQMPLTEAAGKWSYPLDIKEELFRTAREAFQPWHNRVFFYLCMEDPVLWKPVFGYEYASNSDFESDMLYTYQKKILEIRDRGKRKG